MSAAPSRLGRAHCTHTHSVAPQGAAQHARQPERLTKSPRPRVVDFPFGTHERAPSAEARARVSSCSLNACGVHARPQTDWAQTNARARVRRVQTHDAFAAWCALLCGCCCRLCARHLGDTCRECAAPRGVCVSVICVARAPCTVLNVAVRVCRLKIAVVACVRCTAISCARVQPSQADNTPIVTFDLLK